MSGSYVFPSRLFRPPSLKVSLQGAALSGGISLSGEGLFADLSGGGRWSVEFGETNIWRVDQVKAWRALCAASDGGAMPIIVPLADRRHQPLINPLTTPDPFGLSIWDDGLTPWVPDQVTATVTADAALGATELAFSFSAPLNLVGGEHFTFEHATWGPRLYRATRVKSGGVGSGDATVIDFRPPLRQAVEVGDLMNFDSPRCLMRADRLDDVKLDFARFGTGQASFLEAGKPR